MSVPLPAAPAGSRPITTHNPRCFACSSVARGGLGAQLFAVGDDELVLDWAPSPHVEGWPGHLHGGVLATLLDEALGTLVTDVLAYASVTGTLTTVFRDRAPSDAPVRVTARRVGAEGRKVHVAGEAHIAGRLVAEATGVWIVLREDDSRRAGTA